MEAIYVNAPQLDDSIGHLVKDPKREVLENLKKRHGVVSKSPSMNDGIYTFPNRQGSLTNVAAAAQAPLDRATLLERRQSTGSAAGRRQRAASLDRTSRLLEQEQADLERAMQSKAGSVAATPLSAQTDDGKKGKFSWPSMPGIKPQLGGKRDSLQPIGRSRSPRHSVASPVVPSSAASPTGAPGLAPFGASKLPAIGKVPDIKINTSHRPRRDPNDETRAAPAPGSLTEPRGEATRAGSPKASMVTFEGLERPVSGERGESLSDYEEALGDVPTNTLDDMPRDYTCRTYAKFLGLLTPFPLFRIW